MKYVIKKLWEYIIMLDKILILLCVATSAFSVLLLYSIIENEIYLYSPSLYTTQAMASIIGVLAALFVAAIDYKFITKLWFLHVPIAVILVMLTMTGMGVEREGQRAWLNFFGLVQFQPAEVLKISFILSFSFHLFKVEEHMNQPRHILLLCAHGMLPVALIALQQDFGTALVFAFMFLVMLFAAGLSWIYVLIGAVAAPIAGVISWFFIMSDYHRERIMVLFNSENVSAGIGDQQALSKMAIGSGQLYGKGLFDGNYTYVYEMQNDFIFSYIGQTLGFIGCVSTIITLALICLKILTNSRMAKDTLGRNICTGVFAMIAFHTIINVGMNIGVMPVVGIPLPFLSAGGTSVVTLYAAIGLTLSVHAHRTKPYAMFYEKQ